MRLWVVLQKRYWTPHRKLEDLLHHHVLEDDLHNELQNTVLGKDLKDLPSSPRPAFTIKEPTLGLMAVYTGGREGPIGKGVLATWPLLSLSEVLEGRLVNRDTSSEGLRIHRAMPSTSNGQVAPASACAARRTAL